MLGEGWSGGRHACRGDPHLHEYHRYRVILPLVLGSHTARPTLPGRPSIRTLDAADSGKLCIFVAGREATISRCQPLFEVIGRQTVGVGRDPAEANLLQLCVIALFASLFESLREVVVLSERGGIAPDRFQKLMSESVFAAGPHAGYGALIAATRAPAVMTVEQGRRNAALLIETANALDTKLPLMRLLRDELDSLMSRGMATLDWLAVATSGDIGDTGGTPAANSHQGGSQAQGPPTSA